MLSIIESLSVCLSVCGSALYVYWRRGHLEGGMSLRGIDIKK